MRREKDGSFDRDVQHAIRLIKSYEKLLNEAIKLGFCYNDDICTYLHNERAHWINKIEQDSDSELLCKVWKNGTVHVYDREEYLRHTQGKKVAAQWRAAQTRRQYDKGTI